MLDEYLVDTCSRITSSRNIYGDLVGDAGVDVPCRWRPIDNISTATGDNREEKTADAMVWFTPTENIKPGDVLEFEGERYRVTQVTKAKRLGESEVQFLKALTEKWKG